MQNPENLRVSRAAEDLADLVYDYTAAFPVDERFGLTAQVRRAAVSTGSNVYEGCGRQSNKALLPFLYYAHSSAGELQFQTGLATRRKFGDAKLARELDRKLIAFRRAVSRLIRYHEDPRSAAAAPKPRGPSFAVPARAKHARPHVGARAPIASQRA
jgi:four helix bundle protein